MITEIGDVKRFAHPRQLVSWVGMDIREYASGGKSNRFGITRQGNRYLRTAFIEANQRGYRSTKLGKDIKARRADTAPGHCQVNYRSARMSGCKLRQAIVVTDFLPRSSVTLSSYTIGSS